MLLSVLILTLVPFVTCQDYDQTQQIFDTVLHKSRYNTDIRPLINQSQAVHVHVNFELLSIEEVNDITQSFVCNGILNLFWTDERATWNASDYGGQTIIHPAPVKIWRPRLVLVNTLNERDLFGDDHSPTRVESNGHASWFPGSLFPTSCKLDLRKYPFDEQHCHIKMVPMALRVDELLFDAGHAEITTFTENGAWELVGHSIHTGFLEVKTTRLSYFQVNFQIRRRPTFFLINIILPVVLLSFLNILVFAIPVESGDKISYGITVLLAMTVFLSIVGDMLPQSSETIPSVTIYLFSLLIVSVLTVIDCIVIEFLEHLQVKEEKSMNARHTFREAVKNIRRVRNVVRPAMNTPWTLAFPPVNGNHQNNQGLAGDTGKQPADVVPGRGEEEEESQQLSADEDQRNNKYKTIGKHIDWISFVVFIIIWIGVTVWIFCELAT